VRLLRPSGLTVLSAVLLVLLPTLAVLQYRWVGQLSTAERERMQRNLANAAIQFRDTFDTEVARAFGALQVGTATARDGASEQYSDRYGAWFETAEFPDIVKAVYIVDAPDDGLRARRWDTAFHRFEEVPWPDALTPLRARFEEERQEFGSQGGFSRRLLFLDDETLLVAPLRGFRGPASSTDRRPMPIFGFTVVQLDREYLASTVLPALAHRFFIHSEGDSYRVAVVESRDTSKVVYQSDPADPVRPDMADATQSFFGPRGPTLFFGRRGGPGPGPGPVERQPRAFPQTPRDTLGPDGSADQPEDLGRWLVAVRHTSGSLEAAVASVRRRNLGISSGVLLLLSISVLLLAQASRRAHRLARQQMEFVAGVSHELRTPIAVITSAAQNLSHGVVGNADRVKKYGQVMEGEARRLSEMVESVLQYAGLESGRGLGVLVPIAPSDLLDEAIESARRSVGASLQVECTVQANLPPVSGDTTALVSAIQNLIVNAFKYGGDTHWVGVQATHVQRGRRSEVDITVADRGAGIPADELPHIFEPFYRGQHAVGRQIHGNGLGLSLVHRIVRAHGGTVSVRSREHEGTTFTITLPAEPMDPRPTAVHGDAPAAAH
jgi:signal transduction histidine kinase